jgi:hypothetical protein
LHEGNHRNKRRYNGASPFGRLVGRGEKYMILLDKHIIIWRYDGHDTLKKATSRF